MLDPKAESRGVTIKRRDSRIGITGLDLRDGWLRRTHPCRDLVLAQALTLATTTEPAEELATTQSKVDLTGKIRIAHSALRNDLFKEVAASCPSLRHLVPSVTGSCGGIISNPI